jgi:hypothetical protein
MSTIVITEIKLEYREFRRFPLGRGQQVTYRGLGGGSSCLDPRPEGQMGG